MILDKGIKMQNEIRKVKEEIVNRFETYILKPTQVSKIVNKSPSTLERWRKNGIRIKYRKDGNAKNSPIEYTVQDVAEYIVGNRIKIV